MGFVDIVKTCGGLVIGSGCTTLIANFFKPAIQDMHGFQKVAAWCGAACLGGYLGTKATEYFTGSIDEGMALYQSFTAGNPMLITGTGETAVANNE